MRSTKFYLFMGLLASVAFVGGCAKDDMEGSKADAGDNICFGLSDVDSRTEYDSGDVWQINWVDGDQIRIFCDQAYETTKQADYSVLKDAETKHNGTLTANANGLKWGSNNAHTFYALYPGNSSNVVSCDANGVVTLKYNRNQTCTVASSTNGVYTTTPDMANNAYMVAKTTVTPTTGLVNLTFKPIMTTLEITVKAPENQTVTVTGVSVNTNDTNVYVDADGIFKYDLAQDEVVSSITTAINSKTCFIGIKNGDNSYVELAGGQSITLTAFLPACTIGNSATKVRVHLAGSSTGTTTEVSATIKDEIAASSKRKINLPNIVIATTGNNWITPLDDDIYVSQLSIPGTHDAATQACTLDQGKCQDLTIEEQLNMGIRAFDLRPTTRLVSSSNNYKLPIYHGVASCNITMVDVFQTFNDYLDKNPGEFIIVTCRWESEGDTHITVDLLNTKKWDTFNENMTNFINNITYYPAKRKVDFKPDLTVGELRNKILIIMRPNQGTSPDSFYADSALSGTTFISGWPAGGDDVRTGVYFKSQYEGSATGYAIVQDYYNVANTTTKISLIKEELDLSAQSNTNSDYINTWFINHCSGYVGSSTQTTAYSSNASVVNPNIYEYITSSTSTKAVGSTGIMMLDFVGKNVSAASEQVVYGDLLPQTIIDNNYKYYMKRKAE